MLNVNQYSDSMSWMCVCSYTHVVVRTNSDKNVVLRGSISYSLATRSSQMNTEATNDVDPKY